MIWRRALLLDVALLKQRFPVSSLLQKEVYYKRNRGTKPCILNILHAILIFKLLKLSFGLEELNV